MISTNYIFINILISRTQKKHPVMILYLYQCIRNHPANVAFFVILPVLTPNSPNITYLS